MTGTYSLRVFLFTVILMFLCLTTAYAAVPPSRLDFSPLTAYYQDKDLVVEAIITNVGPTASRGIVDCTIDVYDAGKKQVAGAYFRDENLKNLTLNPGQAARWTFALPNPEYNKDLSKFSVDCNIRSRDAGERQLAKGLFLYINSTPVTGKKILMNKRVLAPLQEVFDMFGATVQWDSETQTVTAALGAKIITHQVGTSYILSGDQRIDFDTPSTLLDGQVLIPIRMVARAIGGNIHIAYAETDGTFVVAVHQY